MSEPADEMSLQDRQESCEPHVPLTLSATSKHRSLLEFRRLVPSEVNSMFWLSAVETLARVLSFAFYMLAARLLAPRGFGTVQYTITISMVALGLSQVIATTLIRELGAARGDAARTSEILGSNLALTAGIWIATTLACLIASATHITSGASTVGLLVALAGNIGLQTYFSIARGLGDRGRQAASYVGSSLIQICALGALALVAHVTPLAAIVIYGTTSLVPIVLCELKRPVLLGVALRVTRAGVRRLYSGAGLLLIAQITYLSWSSLDQVWVQHAVGAYQMGIYASAKNLSMTVLVVPGGITGVVLPRISELKSSGEASAARRLVRWGTLATLGLSLAVVLFLAVLRHPLLEIFYGKAYVGASSALILLGLGMAAYATFTTLTMAAVGWNRPGIYTAGITIAALVEAAVFALHPARDLVAASLSYSGGIGVGLGFVVIALWARPPWGTDR